MELCRVSLSLKNSQMRRTNVIKDLWLSVQLLNCILHESLLFLQRAFSTGSDPHQLLTFFSLSTHVWTVSRDTAMEKRMGLRSSRRGWAEPWRPPAKVTAAWISQEKNTWRKVYTQPAPWSGITGTLHDMLSTVWPRNQLLLRDPAALAVVLEPVALVKGVSEFFAGKVLLQWLSEGLKISRTCQLTASPELWEAEQTDLNRKAIFG